MVEHPESNRLIRAVERCANAGIVWAGVLYRSAAPSFATRDELLTGVGAKVAGGRWNSPGSFRTIYTSLEPQTALEEAFGQVRYYGLPPAAAFPRVLVSLKVHLQQVLDLTNGDLRNSLRVSRERLLTEPWREMQDRGEEALTQAIGRIAWQALWEGLLVPSAAHSAGRDLVIFPANLLPGSWLQIVNPEQLPS